MFFVRSLCEEDGSDAEWLRCLWVCRRWRETLAGTGSLWTTVPFDIETHLLERWLRASEHLPLRVLMTLRAGSSFTNLALCGHRVHYLDVCIFDEAALPVLDSVPLPALRALSISRYRCDNTTLNLQNVDHLFARARQWSSFSFNNVFSTQLDIGLFTDLGTLSLDMDRSYWGDCRRQGGALSLLDCIVAVGQMGQLRQLVLAVPVIRNIDAWDRTEPMYTLNRLRSVVFRGDGTDAFTVFKCLAMPIVHTLDLTIYASMPGKIRPPEGPYDDLADLSDVLKRLVASMGVAISEVELWKDRRSEGSFVIQGVNRDASFRLHCVCWKEDVVPAVAASLSGLQLEGINMLVLTCTYAERHDYGNYNPPALDERWQKKNRDEEEDDGDAIAPWSAVFNAIPKVNCLLVSGNADVWRALPNDLCHSGMPWSGLNVTFSRGVMEEQVLQEWVICVEVAFERGRPMCSLDVFDFEMGLGSIEKKRFDGYVGRMEWCQVREGHTRAVYERLG